VSDGGFDLQKKLIRLPRKLRYNLWLMQGQSNKFFSLLPVSNTLTSGIIIFKPSLFFTNSYTGEGMDDMGSITQPSA
jgi:hypothetical protein